MLDSYLFEMEKEKINYIMEHKDQSAQNLNEFFSPEYFNEKDFEIYNSDFLIDINSMRETIENRIRYCNKTFGVNWQLKDTYSELKALNDSGNVFLMYISKFCTLAADVLCNKKTYSYSEAFFVNARYTELAIFNKLQDIFDLQVTLMIIRQFWIEHESQNLKGGL